jgi:hypothetical protein
MELFDPLGVGRDCHTVTMFVIYYATGWYIQCTTYVFLKSSYNSSAAGI